MAVTVAEFKEYKNKVDEHDHWIYGNGDGVPGAKTTLALLCERWGQTEKKIDTLIKVLWGLLVVVLSANVTMLVYLFQQHLIK